MVGDAIFAAIPVAITFGKLYVHGKQEIWFAHSS
jgi:hypothetical protein